MTVNVTNAGALIPRILLKRLGLLYNPCEEISFIIWSKILAAVSVRSSTHHVHGIWPWRRKVTAAEGQDESGCLQNSGLSWTGLFLRKNTPATRTSRKYFPNCISVHFFQQSRIHSRACGYMWRGLHPNPDNLLWDCVFQVLHCVHRLAPQRPRKDYYCCWCVNGVLGPRQDRTIGSVVQSWKL